MQTPWILVLCHEFPPLGGGAGKNLYLLCRELSRRGLRIKVWTGDPGARNRWEHACEVEYIAVGRKNRFETRWFGLLAFIAGAVAKAFASRRDDPPALVFSNLAIPAGVAGALVSRRFKAPHAVWYQGSDVHAGKARGAGWLQHRVVAWIAGRAERNFFVSPGLRDMARSFCRVPNPSLLPTCPSPEILAAATQAPASEAGRYFLFLGRFDLVKNPLLVILAADLLKDGRRLSRAIRMVGGGDLLPAAQKLVRMRALSGRVTLEPAATFERVPELLRSAYALVVPSRVEGFNTTITEAALFGVPAIGSDTAGIRDFIKSGDTGLLFREDDAAALAEALQKLDGDPALRDALGQRARAAAAPYHTGAQADAFLLEAGKSAPGLRVRQTTPSAEAA